MTKSNIALSNLRAVVIVIVVAFHASLAYLASTPSPSAAFDQPPYAWQAFPIVDAHRWLGFDLFCAWQDVSLMSLMFFLSGLFAAGSLARKGARTYVTDRLWRIGLPFALAALFLSPLAYYPAYLTRTVDPTFVGFWRQWLALPSWPAGPQWFLWQLLAVNILAAGLYALVPRYVVWLRRLAAGAGTRPVAFFALLVAVTAAGYAPLALQFSPWRWDAIGPFSLQQSRPLVYLVYFFAGFAVGAHGIDRGLLAPDGALARNWWAWLAAAVLGFAFWAGFTSLTMPHWTQASMLARLGASLAYPVACAAGGLSLLAACLRWSGPRLPALESLSSNAYSIYLLHYPFVVWLQYSLLGSSLFAAAKLAIVLTGALTASWALSVAFGRLAAEVPLAADKRAIFPVR